MYSLPFRRHIRVHSLYKSFSSVTSMILKAAVFGADHAVHYLLSCMIPQNSLARSRGKTETVVLPPAGSDRAMRNVSP